MAESPNMITIPGHGDFRIVPAVNAEGCSDPRFEDLTVPNEGSLIHDQARQVGELRSLGATLGRIMAARVVIGSRMTVQGVSDMVIRWQLAEKRTPSMHEAHICQDPLGCGHVDNAASGTYERGYNISSEDVLAVVDHVVDSARNNELEVVSPVLSGPHIEKGLLIVESQDFTVDPAGKYFRHDHGRDETAYESLAGYITAEHSLDVTAPELSIAAARQRSVTLGILAAGLPAWEIEIGQGTSSVRKLDPIPAFNP